MARSDIELNHIAMLCTLDYLLKKTDEKHPARQVDICRYAAEKYNLIYNEGGTAGSEIKRQRVGKCLKFLEKASESYPAEFPFVLRRTDGNKYYLESRGYLERKEIIKVLAAVKSDRFIKDEDTDDLIERLLDIYASEGLREEYKDEANCFSEGTYKAGASLRRKIKLLQTAYTEKKTILINKTVLEFPGKMAIALGRSRLPKANLSQLRCRVYKIRQYEGKPYAILVPINHSGIVFEEAAKLVIPDLPERELLMEDEPGNDRLESLFATNNPLLAKYYRGLKSYVETMVRPEKGRDGRIEFTFPYRYLSEIKQSFEWHFGIAMPWRAISEILPHYCKDGTQVLFDEYIPTKGGEVPALGLVERKMNQEAFFSWLMSNPEIADVIDIASPYDAKKILGMRYLGMALKYRDVVPRKTWDNITAGSYGERDRYALVHYHDGEIFDTISEHKPMRPRRKPKENKGS